MVLYFFNNLPLFMRKYITLLSLLPSLSLNVLTYPLILGNNKTHRFITSSKYPIKYLELVFVLINFEMTILSTLTSQIFIVFFCIIKSLFCYFCLAKSQH